MNYNEILAAARECIGPYCKACPVCNGRGMVKKTAEGDITIEPFTPEQFRQKSWHELSQLESGIVDQQTRYP